jgi:hypothetical protein
MSNFFFYFLFFIFIFYFFSDYILFVIVTYGDNTFRRGLLVFGGGMSRLSFMFMQ